jgi:outer membrane protein assembly factor BamB
MRFQYCIAALFIAVFAVGCSSDKEQIIKPAKLVNFKPVSQFEVRWKQSVGEVDYNVLSPALTSNSVLAANFKGEIQRFDLAKGNRLWKIKSGFIVSGGVGAGDGLVFVGGEKGDLAAFDEVTGQLRWQTKVSSEVLSAPKFAEGVVVVRTGDGRIFGLDSKDGKRLWLYERATPALTARSNAGVTIRKGTVYVGFAAGKLAAIGLHNGVIVWEASVSQPRGNTELERISDITSLPIVDDSQVCAVAFQGRLVCFDAEQGGALWTRDVASDKGLTMSRKYLFVSDSVGSVFGLDKLSGSSYWKNDQLALRGTTAPLALDNVLIVADFEGYLHALSRDDGRFLARFKTDGSAIRAVPIEADGGFVALTTNGSLYSIVIH